MKTLYHIESAPTATADELERQAVERGTRRSWVEAALPGWRAYIDRVEAANIRPYDGPNLVGEIQSTTAEQRRTRLRQTIRHESRDFLTYAPSLLGQFVNVECDTCSRTLFDTMPTETLLVHVGGVGGESHPAFRATCIGCGRCYHIRSPFRVWKHVS